MTTPVSRRRRSWASRFPHRGSVRLVEVGGATVAVYIRKAAVGYLRTLDRFDDATVNRKPPGPDTNSGTVIVTHAWAAARFWIDHAGLGHPTDRVRADEFTAVSTVAELKELVLTTADRLADSVLSYDAGPTGTRNEARDRLADASDDTGDGSDGSIVVHALEELFQHLGHLELTADALT
jgi:hypothetical protein